MALSFRLLGSLEVWEDGRELPLGPGRQRALLTLLLLHANEAMSADRLIEELWAGRPPASAQKVLQGYVSQLRKALPEDVLVTRPTGYLVAVGETDAGEFERLVGEAHAQEPEEAARTLRVALELWRGRPLADVEYESWAQVEIARLEELRLTAVEERLEAELQLGLHARLVPELEALVANHPLRERLRGQLMLALYRCGRQAEALEVYRRGRQALVEELGLEPSPALEQLEKQILTHDEALAGPPRRLLVPAGIARKGWILALAGALLLAGAIAAGAWELTRGSGTATALTGNAVATIDPQTGRLMARIPIGKAPTSVSVGAGAVWAMNTDEESVSRIDPRTRRVVATFRTGATPSDLVVGGGALWLVNGRASSDSSLVGFSYPDSVSRLDPSSAVVTRTVRLPRASVSFSRLVGVSAIAIGRNAVWAIDPDQSVSRIDPRTGRVVATIDGLGAVALVVSDGAVWVDDGQSTVVRIDAHTNRITARIPLGASSLEGIAVGAGAVWVADAQDGTVWRIDPEPRPLTRTISVGIGATSLSFGGGALWVSNPFFGTVSRIDPGTNTVTRTIDVGGTPNSLAAGLGGVWVSVAGPPVKGPQESGVEALPARTCGPVVSSGGKARFLIASDLPLLGSRATIPTMQAIQLVLQRHHFRAGKYAVGYQSCDDSTAQAGFADFGTCGANAKAYAADKDLLGVIGPLDSDCAVAEIPIENRAPSGPVAMISPLNTNVGLTHRGPTTRPGELALLYPTGRRNYVRIIAPDDFQGAAEAILARQLGLGRVYVLTDGGDFGRTLMGGFVHAAGKLGLKVAGVSHWAEGVRSYASLARVIDRSGADGILLAGYGGSSAGRLVRDLRASLGSRIPLLAGDGFLTIPSLLDTAGPAARGMYVSFAGRPNERLPASGQEFVRAFGATQPSPRVASYAAAYGAQAAEVLLTAISRSDGTRNSVNQQLFASKIRGGILGDFGFTAEGDMTPSPVTIFRVTGGKRPSSTLETDFEGSVVDRVVNVPPALAR